MLLISVWIVEGSFDFLVSIFLACFGDELAPAYLKLHFPAYLKLFAWKKGKSTQEDPSLAIIMES